MKKEKLDVEKQLHFRLFAILIFYIIIGYIAIMFLQYLFSKFYNPIMKYLQMRIDVIFILYLVIGLTCIFYYFWKKPWKYLEEVITATQTVYEQNKHSISLSEPLREVEHQMNEIKMSVLLNEQAAKEAENKKNELVMYLAHDIRTPLTTVIGYLSLLDEAPDMPMDQKAKYIRIVLEKAERLETLINELFEITRYHTNTVQMKKKQIDLYALLAQVIDDFYPVLSSNGNNVSVSAEDNLFIWGDPEKLARVFNNLLKNAVAYSYPKTEISIFVEKKENDIILVFKNYGATIPAEQLPIIFEKFNRLDNARVSDTGGAGLGLSIAKEIINLHGGKIVAQSSNETIIFTITLPCAS